MPVYLTPLCSIVKKFSRDWSGMKSLTNVHPTTFLIINIYRFCLSGNILENSCNRNSHKQWLQGANFIAVIVLWWTLSASLYLVHGATFILAISSLCVVPSLPNNIHVLVKYKCELFWWFQIFHYYMEGQRYWNWIVIILHPVYLLICGKHN